jgi:hypothetical protein
MKYRKLRIAWSVAWGIVSVLLVAFTLRSYWIVDVIGRGDFAPSDTTLTAVLLDRGILAIDRRTLPNVSPSLKGLTDQWTHHTTKTKADGKIDHFRWIKCGGAAGRVHVAKLLDRRCNWPWGLRAFRPKPTLVPPKLSISAALTKVTSPRKLSIAMSARSPLRVSESLRQ